MLLVLENVVQELIQADLDLGCRLAMVSFPQLVFLAEARLDLPVRKGIMNVSSATSPITSMLAHDLAQQLLDHRLERPIGRHVEAGESEVGGLQTPIQRTHVIPLWRRHLGLSGLLREEVVVGESLLLAILGKVRVVPEEFAVAVEFGPVVVPGFGTVLGFANVV